MHCMSAEYADNDPYSKQPRQKKPIERTDNVTIPKRTFANSRAAECLACRQDCLALEPFFGKRPQRQVANSKKWKTLFHLPSSGASDGELQQKPSLHLRTGASSTLVLQQQQSRGSRGRHRHRRRHFTAAVAAIPAEGDNHRRPALPHPTPCGSAYTARNGEPR